MSSAQSSERPRRGGVRIPPAELVKSLATGMTGELVPLVTEALRAEHDELRRLLHGDSPPADGLDDIANLNVLAGQIAACERRWRERFGRALRDWPDPPAALEGDGFDLMSDDDLQAQLIAHPMAETLERRHGDILATIEKRLWSLAATMGGQVRPDNPFSPRHVAESFVHTFRVADTGQRLQAALLARCERLAAERLAQAYERCNRQLADAGFAPADVSDYATLAAAVMGSPDWATEGLWDGGGGTVAGNPRGRNAGGAAPGAPRSTSRGDALRHAARALRERLGGRPEGGRPLRDEEFRAVLSLMQGEPSTPQDTDGRYADALRAGLARVAGNLGIDSDSAVPSEAQADALDLVAALFGELDGHFLSAGAREWLARLVLPYVRLALSEPSLFDPPPLPAMRVLSRLVELWDGNRRATAADAELHDLADAVAGQLAQDQSQDDETVFERALQRLERELEPLRKRAQVSERRAWQAVEGGERLDAARRAADRELQARLDAQPLLPEVGAFLSDEWRQSLAQAWLRAGPASERYTDAVALGDALVRLDADAAHARGALVADRLIALQPRLHACYLACGLDERAATSLFARLVAEFANPDAPRALREFTPLSKSPAMDAGAPGADIVNGLALGQALVQVENGCPVRVLRLVWRSDLTGASLLVNSQGTRELLLSPVDLAARLAEGALVPRPTAGAVEAALRRLSDGLPAPAAD